MERTAQPKPARGSARKAKARGKRREGVVAKSVRQQCVERDGYCVIDTRAEAIAQLILSPCEGPSEWAHVEDKRRCFTRGQAPEVRHTTAGSCQMCRGHHRAYDAHRFALVPSTERGMDGDFKVRFR